MMIEKLAARVFGMHRDHHAIAWGMASVALFVLMATVVRAAKEIAVAYHFGVSAEVDAYRFVLALVTWPVSVWLSVITVVLVPLAARIRQDALDELPRFRSELFGLTILIGLILGSLALVGMPMLLRASWLGLPSSTASLAVSISSTLSILVPCGLIISLFSVWMLEARRHVNTLFTGVPDLAILLTILAVSSGGVAPLVWGTVAGYLLHLATLAAPLARKGELEAPAFVRTSPQWTPFWHGFCVMLAGQALMSLTSIVDQFFAAKFGVGAIATLGYANQMMLLVLGLGAYSIGRATLPIFSKAQTHAGRHVQRVAMQWAGLMFALGLASLLGGWLLAPWATGILFERGAFTSRDTANVAELLRYGLVQLPFYFAGIVLVSLLASQGRHRVIALIAGANLVTKLAATAVLVPILGLNGLLIATAIMYSISALLCWLAVHRASIETQ